MRNSAVGTQFWILKKKNKIKHVMKHKDIQRNRKPTEYAIQWNWSITTKEECQTSDLLIDLNDSQLNYGLFFMILPMLSLMMSMGFFLAEDLLASLEQTFLMTIDRLIQLEPKGKKADNSSFESGVNTSFENGACIAWFCIDVIGAQRRFFQFSVHENAHKHF